MHHRVMIVFGTRPEAIKMAPVITALKEQNQIDCRVTVTGQHRQMLDQVLELFHIQPDDDLNVMDERQTLPELSCRMLLKMTAALQSRKPDIVLVQGDTSTTFAATLASFYAKVPVWYVEAGLRTGDMRNPWPEEANRRLTTLLTSRHFAPTAGARDNLLREGVDPTAVKVVGNTVIDALLGVVSRIRDDSGLRLALARRFPFLNSGKRLLLVTAHRRESFGEGLEHICLALLDIASRNDVQIVYPVHLNPNVREPVYRLLASTGNVFLIEPQDYLPFVYLMSRSYLILTDSGGIQEEAPSLGVPVLVMRRTTERPEGIAAGTCRLIGTDRLQIVRETTRLLDNEQAYGAMAHSRNPYGDGLAARRIVQSLVDHFGLRGGRSRIAAIKQQ